MFTYFHLWWLFPLLWVMFLVSWSWAMKQRQGIHHVFDHTICFHMLASENEWWGSDRHLFSFLSFWRNQGHSCSYRSSYEFQSCGVISKQGWQPATGVRATMQVMWGCWKQQPHVVTPPVRNKLSSTEPSPSVPGGTLCSWVRPTWAWRNKSITTWKVFVSTVGNWLFLGR